MSQNIKNSALLIIDVQRDFCMGGALEVKDGDQVVPVINKLVEKIPLVVASQDWHPKKHGSFAKVAGKDLYSQFDLNGLPQTAWPEHCVQGYLGAEFHPNLDIRPIAAVFRKGMDPSVDSYSAFYDNAKRNDTGLAAYLKGKGVQTLYIAGLATDYCVKFTALDALELGFKVFVLEDGCRGVNIKPEDSHNALTEIIAKGGGVLNGEVLAACL